MKAIKIILPILLITVVLWSVRSCYSDEIRRTSISSLSKERINSADYPWSVSAGTINQVTNYREAYDLDSNDWIAQFSLIPSEAKKLSSILTAIPEEEKQYRCGSSIVGWVINYDICSFEKMTGLGFKGYFYKTSFCEDGCKQSIVLWVNESSGESYLIGAPDYK